jgi:hypothetical protein
MESELILSRGGLPPLSARGCVQHLMPIESGALRRTINGALVYTGKASSHKYRSIISCEDKASLALEGFWRGSEIRVGCIHRLWQKAYGSEVVLDRDPVDGTVCIITSTGQERGEKEITGRKVVIGDLTETEAFVAYRPWLYMRVVTFSFMTNEWGLKSGWRLELEEI